jgi:hypothetical protein
MDQQKARKSRIRVPSHEQFEERSKPFRTNNPAARDKAVRQGRVRIIWTLVCGGYQPELANAWGQCTSAFRAEAKQDRVFEECLFWVVTRSIDCFY